MAVPYAEDHEVYPNPPLRLVAAEVRYPLTPRLADPGITATLRARLEDRFPIYNPLSEQTVEFGVGDRDGGPSVKSTKHSILRVLTADRTASATIAPTRTIVEVSEYTRYGAFRELIQRVLSTLHEAGQPRFFDRLGLRYIDEIRVPEITELPGDWSPFITSLLLGPARLGRKDTLEPHSWEGTIRFDTGIETGVQMRYGVAEGAAINPTGVLRIRPNESPVYFLVDLDSFWVSGDFIEYELEEVLTKFDDLHRPIRELFESLITDRLRDDVLRRR